MSKPKILIRAFVIILVLIFSGAVFSAPKVYVPPIIMYHSVNLEVRAKDRLTVSVKAFERQMRFLKTHNYNVLSLESLADLIKEKKKIPPKTIAITFDDGYKDNYIYAFPILKKYNLPATVFVIINEVGRSDRLSWEEIKTMQDSRLITFGSHCLGPEPLVNIKSNRKLMVEIFDSKRILEESLGKKVNMFSYPGGMFDNKIRQLVIEAGYKLAVSTSPGKKFANDDLFALKRLRISATSDNLFVFWIQISGYYNFIREHRHK